MYWIGRPRGWARDRYRGRDQAPARERYWDRGTGMRIGPGVREVGSRGISGGVCIPHPIRVVATATIHCRQNLGRFVMKAP
jgi:hypothetical protein